MYSLSIGWDLSSLGKQRHKTTSKGNAIMFFSGEFYRRQTAFLPVLLLFCCICDPSPVCFKIRFFSGSLSSSCLRLGRSTGMVCVWWWIVNSEESTTEGACSTTKARNENVQCMKLILVVASSRLTFCTQLSSLSRHIPVRLNTLSKMKFRFRIDFQLLGLSRVCFIIIKV